MYVEWYQVVDKDGNWLKDADGMFLPLQPTREHAEQIAGFASNGAFEEDPEYKIIIIKQPIKNE